MITEEKIKKSAAIFEDLKPELLRLLSSYPQFGSIGMKLSFQKGKRSTTEWSINVSELYQESNDGI